MANITENTTINLNLNDNGQSGQISLSAESIIFHQYAAGGSAVISNASITDQESLSSDSYRWITSHLVGEGTTPLMTVTITTPNEGSPTILPDSAASNVYYQLYFADSPVNVSISEEFQDYVNWDIISSTSSQIVIQFTATGITQEIAEEELIIQIEPNIENGYVKAYYDGSPAVVVSVPDEETSVNLQIQTDGLSYAGNYNVVDTNDPSANASVTQTSPNELSVVTNENTGDPRSYFVDFFAVENTTSQYNYRTKVMQAFGQNVYGFLQDVYVSGYLDDEDDPYTTVNVYGFNSSGFPNTTSGQNDYYNSVFTFPAAGAVGVTSNLTLDAYTPYEWPSGAAAVAIFGMVPEGYFGVELETPTGGQFNVINQFLTNVTTHAWIVPFNDTTGPNQGNFQFTVLPNLTTQPRRAMITYMHPDDPNEFDVVWIKQEAGFNPEEDTTTVKYNQNQTLTDGSTFDALSDFYDSNLSFEDGVEIVHPLEIDKDANSFILLLNCPNADPLSAPDLQIEPFPNSDIYDETDYLQYLSNGNISVSAVYPSSVSGYTHYVKVSIDEFAHSPGATNPYAPSSQMQANDTPYRLFKINITHPNNITGSPDGQVVIRQFGRAVTYFITDGGASYGSSSDIYTGASNISSLEYTEGGITIPMFTSSKAGVLNLTQPLIATGELADGSVDTGEYVQPIVATTQYFARYENGEIAANFDSGNTGLLTMSPTQVQDWMPATTGDTVWPDQPEYINFTFDSTNAQTGLYNLTVNIDSWVPGSPGADAADGGEYSYREFLIACWNGNVVQGGVTTDQFTLAGKTDLIRIVQYPSEPSWLKFGQTRTGGTGMGSYQPEPLTFGNEGVLYDFINDAGAYGTTLLGQGFANFYVPDGLGGSNNPATQWSQLHLLFTEITYMSPAGALAAKFAGTNGFFKIDDDGTQYGSSVYAGTGNYYVSRPPLDSSYGSSVTEKVFSITDTLVETVDDGTGSVYEKRKFRVDWVNPGDLLTDAGTSFVEQFTLHITFAGNEGNLDIAGGVSIADSLKPHKVSFHRFKTGPVGTTAYINAL